MIAAVCEKKQGRDGLSSFQTLVISTATRVGMGNLVGVVAEMCIRDRAGTTRAVAAMHRAAREHPGAILAIGKMCIRDSHPCNLKSACTLFLRRQHMLSRRATALLALLVCCDH